MRRLSLLSLPLTLWFALCTPAQQSSVATLQQATATPASATSDTMTVRQTEELRADILAARKVYPEAIAIYQQLLELDPKNAELLNKIGIAYQQQGMNDRSESYYKRALKADKNEVSAMNNLGTVLYAKRKYRKAIRLYKQALDAKPDMPVVYSNLGYAYFGDKKNNEALDAFRKALALDPDIFQHRGGSGFVVQQRSVDDFGKFYFLVAKTFALSGDVERCAHFLKMARDEGYKNISAVRNDPAFANVVNDPRVQEVLQGPTSARMRPQDSPQP